MRTIVPVFLLALLAACAGASTTPSSGAPGAAADAARLYRSKCSGCHRPYEPPTRTRAEWHAALARMAPKAHLSGAEADAIRGYLDAGASDAQASERR